MSENKASFVRMEEDDNTPCRPKSVHKRRSTFFRRRSTLQARDKDGSENVLNTDKLDTRMKGRIENSDPGNLESKKTKEAPFDLQKYIDDLKQERKMWKQTLHDRKRQRKSILKQMSNIKQGEQDLDLSALSETERNFLLVRPNYEHICEKGKKLSVMAAESSILNDHVMHLQKRCISRAEKKLDDLTKRIIKLVD